MFFLIFLGVVMLAGVAYLAVSKQSSFKIRIAALGALAVMVLTAIICLVLVMTAKAPKPEGFIPFMESTAAPPAKNNPLMSIVFVLLLIAFFGGGVVLSMQEQKKNKGR